MSEWMSRLFPRRTVWAALKEWCDEAAGVATVLGFVVTLVGFGITILRLRKTQAAAAAAQKAAADALEQVSGRLLLASTAELRLTYNDLRHSIIGEDWIRVLYRGYEVRGHLARLVEAELVAEEIRLEIVGAMDDLALVLRRIEGLREKGKPVVLTTQNRKGLDKVQVLLGRVEQRLRFPAESSS